MSILRLAGSLALLATVGSIVACAEQRTIVSVPVIPYTCQWEEGDAKTRGLAGELADKTFLTNYPHAAQALADYHKTRRALNGGNDPECIK